MRKLLIGFLFLFLDFHLNLDTHTIGLIPDFVGYIFLIQGLDEMSSFSPRFPKARPFALGMAIYCGILYALDLFGISFALGYFAAVLGMIGTSVSLYLSYQIVCGIREIEATRALFLNGETLLSTWKTLVIVQLITYLSLFISALAIVCLIVSFIFTVIFLVAFNTSKNLFEAIPPDKPIQKGEFHEE